MQTNPVVIFAIAKSGSSMTARIFHEHGLWVGAYIEKNGYPCYENSNIKRVVSSYGYRKDWRSRFKWRSKTQVDNCRRAVLECVPDNASWVYKCAVDWYWMFRDMFPSMRSVLIYRNVDSISASLYQQSGKTHMRRIQLQRSWLDKIDAPEVNTDELLAGDYTSIENALQACGITPDPAIIEHCIEPDRWHHRI